MIEKTGNKKRVRTVAIWALAGALATAGLFVANPAHAFVHPAILPDGAKLVGMRNIATNLCLSSEAGVSTTTCAGYPPSQLWVMVPVEDGHYYQIQAYLSEGKCLDGRKSDDGSPSNPVYINDCNDGDYQKFELINYVSFRSKATGWILDSGGGDGQTGNVYLHENAHFGPNQQWDIREPV